MVIKLSLAELSLISKQFRFGSVVSLVLFILKVLSKVGEEVSTTGVTQGNLELPLPSDSLDSHQTQEQ